MIKKLAAMLGLTCGVLGANASALYMTVEQKSGEKYSFLLADNPVVTYKDGNLVVNGNATTSYAIDGVKNYHFTEKDLSITEKTVSNQLYISVGDNSVAIENASAQSRVMLASASGATIATTETDAQGAATIALPNQQGIYVLTVDEKSFKLIRK